MSVRNDEFRKLLVIAGCVLLAAAMTGFAIAAVSAAPPADEEPLVNESVEVTDFANESVYLDAEFAEQGSLDAYLSNETGAAVANATVTGNAGVTESHEFALASNGTYRLEVYANASHLEQVWVSTAPGGNKSALLAGSPGSDSDLPIPWWAAAALLIIVVAGVGLAAGVER